MPGLYPEELLPGIFVEQCQSQEGIAALTPSEWVHVRRVMRSCAWTGLGIETGRAYGRANFLADCRDLAILDVSAWELGDVAPTPEHRAWAVEFPIASTTDYQRRRFWFQSRHDVRALIAEFQQRRARMVSEQGARRIERALTTPRRLNARAVQGRGRLPKPLFDFRRGEGAQ